MARGILLLQHTHQSWRSTNDTEVHKQHDICLLVFGFVLRNACMRSTSAVIDVGKAEKFPAQSPLLKQTSLRRLKVGRNESCAPWAICPAGYHIRGSSIPSILVQLTYTIQVHLLDLGDVGRKQQHPWTLSDFWSVPDPLSPPCRLESLRSNIEKRVELTYVGCPSLVLCMLALLPNCRRNFRRWSLLRSAISKHMWCILLEFIISQLTARCEPTSAQSLITIQLHSLRLQHELQVYRRANSLNIRPAQFHKHMQCAKIQSRNSVLSELLIPFEIFQ